MKAGDAFLTFLIGSGLVGVVGASIVAVFEHFPGRWGYERGMPARARVIGAAVALVACVVVPSFALAFLLLPEPIKAAHRTAYRAYATYLSALDWRSITLPAGILLVAILANIFAVIDHFRWRYERGMSARARVIGAAMALAGVVVPFFALAFLLALDWRSIALPVGILLVAILATIYAVIGAFRRRYERGMPVDVIGAAVALACMFALVAFVFVPFVAFAFLLLFSKPDQAAFRAEYRACAAYLSTLDWHSIALSVGILLVAISGVMKLRTLFRLRGFKEPSTWKSKTVPVFTLEDLFKYEELLTKDRDALVDQDIGPIVERLIVRHCWQVGTAMTLLGCTALSLAFLGWVHAGHSFRAVFDNPVPYLFGAVGGFFGLVLAAVGPTYVVKAVRFRAYFKKRSPVHRQGSLCQYCRYYDAGHVDRQQNYMSCYSGHRQLTSEELQSPSEWESSSCDGPAMFKRRDCPDWKYRGGIFYVAPDPWWG
jgi:MFS family permease